MGFNNKRNIKAMLKRCSALVLLSVLLATAASAQLSCEVGVGQQLASTYRQWQSALSAYSEVQTEYSSCAASRPREQCKDKYSKLARVAKFSEAEKEYSSCVESQVREQCKDEILNSNLLGRFWKPPSPNTRAGARTIVFSSLELLSEECDHWVYGL